ncbi:SAM-dependent methyltransferase [Actinoplanes sp. NPDC026623]|uniref:class I SAM-dependent methyltransferase n=1 Tax=Actinoplanes sp. NPDC026623 TaxID=3155610 RepID=UPI0033ECF78A
MRNKTSRSAEHVTLFRALESARGRDKIFDDPYAVKFLPGPYRLVARLARVPAIGRQVEHYIDERWPAGPRASAVARTRLIDDLVGEAFADGAGQVLLLGAGYDSRAYRLAAMGSARVFEIDHPATQKTKLRFIRAHVRPDRRAHVRFVPVDLDRDDLATALREHGFAGRERTVVVWEGVTNYLTGHAVDATLRGLAGLTAGGSRLIFTYVDRAALDGTGGFSGVEEWHAAVRRNGEPWTFGFDPDELARYLSERGMRLSLDMSAHAAADRYLTPLGRHERAAPFYRIAQAEVL